MSDPTLIFVMLGCLLLSFLMAGMEAGMLAVSRLRVRQRMRAGDPAARTLHGFLQNPERFLWTILIGNTAAHFAAITLSLVLLHRWLGDRPALWLPALAALVFIFYALVDLLPKMLFRQHANRLPLALARPFRFLHLCLRPFVAPVAWLADGLLRVTGGQRLTGRLFGNREELLMLMKESSSALDREERLLVDRVLDLQNVTVGAITRPLAKVVTAEAATPIAEVFETMRRTTFSRLPVRAPGDGRILGIVSLRTSLYLADIRNKQTAGDFLQPAAYLPESMSLEVALKRLREGGQRMAIVLDRNRREIGILTLSDILRFVFGDITL